MRFDFENHPEVIAGLSERRDGSMIWSNKLPVDASVAKRRDAYFQAQGIRPDTVFAGGLTHGTDIAVIDEGVAGRYLLNKDGLVTNRPGVFLSITAADCLPVYFYNPVKRCIGIAHAGWRGLTAGILEKMVRVLEEKYQSQPDDLLVTLGSCIKACHFEIQQDVAEEFSASSVDSREGKIYASIPSEAILRLQAVGVHQIRDKSDCTYCHADTLFSARYDKADPILGMTAYIGMRG